MFERRSDKRDDGGARLVNYALSCLSVVLAAMMLWFGATLHITRTEYSILFLGISMAISALTILQKGGFLLLKGKWLVTLASSLIAFALVPSVYFYVEYLPLQRFRAGDYTQIDFVLGGLFLIPLLLLTLKETGPSLFILLLVFLFYSFFGFLFPDVFYHAGMDLGRLIQVDVLEFEGVHGLLLGTIVTWVAVFLLYAGLIQGFGSLDVVVKMCQKAFGGRRTLFPQVPVVSSMVFGSFSGSSGANVAVDGAVTIPLLERAGIPAKMAAGIEAVASSGGTVMPPIMGTIAFLMAQFLGMSYLEIVLIGFLPAVIFYIGTAAATYWSTKPFMIQSKALSMADEEITIDRSELLNLAPLVVSISVIFVYMGMLMPIMRSVMNGIAVYVVLQLAVEIFARDGGPIATVLRKFIGEIYTAVKYFALPAAMTAVVGGSLAIAIKALTYTTLGAKISYGLVNVSENNLMYMMAFILVIATIFGMTVGGIATYIIMASILVTPLVKFGVEPLVTHFMLFYFGAGALITPPVAGSVIVAAAIAGTGYMETGWAAMKVGASLLIMPLAFLTYPELVVLGPQTPLAGVLVTLGVIGLAYGLNKHDQDRKSVVLRTICLVASLVVLIYPDTIFRVGGGALVVAIVAGGWAFEKARLRLLRGAALPSGQRS